MTDCRDCQLNIIAGWATTCPKCKAEQFAQKAMMKIEAMEALRRFPDDSYRFIPEGMIGWPFPRPIKSKPPAPVPCPDTCECAKEKFNFMFHERWCPDYVHPFAAMEMKTAEVKRENYMTPGDKAGRLAGLMK